MRSKTKKSISRLLGIWTFLVLLIFKGAFPKPAFAFLSSLDACAAQPECATAIASEVAPAVATPTASGVATTITSTTAAGATTASEAAAGVTVVGDMRLSGIAAYYLWSRGVNGQAQERAKQRYCATYPDDEVCVPFKGGQNPVEYIVYGVDGWFFSHPVPWRTYGTVVGPLQSYRFDRNVHYNTTIIFNEDGSKQRLLHTYDSQGNYQGYLNGTTPTMRVTRVERADGKPDTGGNPPPLPWQQWPQEKRSTAVASLTASDWLGLINSMPVGGRLIPGDQVNAPSGIIIPGQEEDDPNTPADERLLRKDQGFFTVPLDDFDLDGKPDDFDTDDDNDGLPDTSDPGPRSPIVPMASDDDDSLVSEPGEPEKGTPEHKAERWADYQERGGTWDYERWSNNYDQNMVRARNANAAVDTYHDEIGWGEREVTVDTGGERRRLDIADVLNQRGVEYKTGYITRSPEINSEVRRDAILVERGWEIEWVFQGRASEPLLEDLRNAGIEYKFREP